jgi:hypothetical protein
MKFKRSDEVIVEIDHKVDNAGDVRLEAGGVLILTVKTDGRLVLNTTPIQVQQLKQMGFQTVDMGGGKQAVSVGVNP